MSLADIAGAIGSVATGGLTGLIGGVAEKVYAYKAKQLDVQIQVQKFQHDLDMKKADAEIMNQEWRARTQVANIEAQDHAEVSANQAFSAALTAEPQRYSDSSKVTPAQEWLMVILDTVRGLIRPSLTIYLCLITTAIYIQSRELLGNNSLGVDQASALLNKIIDAVLYLTVLVVSFWFGSRSHAKPPKV